MAYTVPIGYFDEARNVEEYNAEKKKREDDKNRAEEKRYIKRYENPNTIVGYKGQKLKYKDARVSTPEDHIRERNANHRIDLENVDRKYDGKTQIRSKDREVASDALNRHMRRHPERYKESCGIFESVDIMGPYTNVSVYNSNDYDSLYESCYGLVLENGECFRDVSFLVTPELIDECCGDIDLACQCALTEGAKLDLALRNFLKEGQDYKGLKQDLKEIIKANDLDDDKLKTGHRGFMHACKRILQVLEDVGVYLGAASTAVSTVNKVSVAGKVNAAMISLGGAAAISIPAIVVGAIISYVIGFLINRLFRLLWDTIEFNTVKKDAEEIIDQLESNAKKVEDPKLKKKYEDAADKLRESIRKHSK